MFRIIRDDLTGVTIYYEAENIGEGFVKGIMTIADPNLALMHKRQIRGITGVDAPLAKKMQALIVMREETREEMTKEYVYKHFLEFMKPTKIIDEEGKIVDV